MDFKRKLKLSFILAVAAFGSAFPAWSQTCTVTASQTYQYIHCIGASSAWSSLDGLGTEFFANDNVNGHIGLTSLRARIDPTSNFSPEVSTLVQAKAANPNVLFWATEWSPPAQYKANDNVDGGASNDTFLGASSGSPNSDDTGYASYQVSFIQYAQSQGVSLYSLSIQNEPNFNPTYEACLWTAGQFDVYTQAFHSALQSAGLSTKIMLPEPDNEYGMNLATTAMQDPNSAPYIGIINTHLYGSFYDNPSQLASSYGITLSSSQEWWETEISDSPTTTMVGGLGEAAQIHQSLVEGQMNAFHYWWLTDLINNNQITTLAYVLGNYSKFIRPGYYRMGATEGPQAGVTVSAYKNTNNSSPTTIVIVAINYNNKSVNQTFSLSGVNVTSVTPWLTDDQYGDSGNGLVQQSQVAVSNNQFTYSMPVSSVVSFVGVVSGSNPTATNTPVPPTATHTNTPVPPTATFTHTNTPVPPTATNTFTATHTSTPVPPTATRTNTPVPPTATNTNSPVPPTATHTAVPPTATGTNTPVPPTATITNSPVPPTVTNTPLPPTVTNTPAPPTATATITNTPLPPTSTNTPVPPTATGTYTPVPPTATHTLVPPTATFTLTPLPPTDTPTAVIASGAFTVQLLSGVTSDTTNSPHPFIQVVNTGTGPLNLNNVTVRYWFNCDCTTQSLQAWVDWAGLIPAGTSETSNVQVSVQPTSLGGQTDYVLYSFTGNLVLQPGQIIQIQSRFNKSDWSNMNQANDWSFAPYTSYTNAPQVTGYLSGALVWGEQPAGAAAAALKVASVISFPNPSTGNGTTLSFTLLGSRSGASAADLSENNPSLVDANAKITLSIYSLGYRLIWTQTLTGGGYGTTGPHDVYWNERDLGGSKLANGVYFLRVTVESNGQTTSSIAKILILG